MVYQNHRYDFVKCEKNKDMLFFYLWNPHGNNPDTNNNYYLKEYEKINDINFKGLKNGDIILDFERFFISFRRLSYQNKEEILNMNKKFKIKTVDPLDTIGLLISQYYFNFYEFTVELPLLWLRIFYNKGKDYKNILSDLINEIGVTKGMTHEQSLWLVYLFYKLKSEILKNQKI